MGTRSGSGMHKGGAWPGRVRTLQGSPVPCAHFGWSQEKDHHLSPRRQQLHHSSTRTQVPSNSENKRQPMTHPYAHVAPCLVKYAVLGLRPGCLAASTAAGPHTTSACAVSAASRSVPVIPG